MSIRQNVLIAPYNDSAILLKHALYENKDTYNFLGYIDQSKKIKIKCDYDVYQSNDLKSLTIDKIFITPSRFDREIVNDLISKDISFNTIMYAIPFANHFIFTRKRYEWIYWLRNNFFSQKDINVSKVNRYRNIHFGKRCFIIGNGPSLNYEHLEVLKNEITFGCNAIHLAYEHTTWRPTYYSICDSFAMEMNFPLIKETLLNGTSIGLFPSHLSSSTPYHKKLIFYPSNHANKTNFDLTKGIYTGETVAYSLISIAIFMGCKEIYLLGMDFSVPDQSNAQKNHFSNSYPEAKDQDILTVHVQKWLEDFEYLQERIKPLNVQIFNTTPNGNLKIFPKVLFNSIFDNH